MCFIAISSRNQPHVCLHIPVGLLIVVTKIRKVSVLSTLPVPGLLFTSSALHHAPTSLSAVSLMKTRNKNVIKINNQEEIIYFILWVEGRAALNCL